MTLLELLLLPFGASYRLAVWWPLLAYAAWTVLVRVCGIESARARFLSLIALIGLQPLLFLYPLITGLGFNPEGLGDRLVSVPSSWRPLEADSHPFAAWQTFLLLWPYLLISFGMLGASLLGAIEYLTAAFRVWRIPKTLTAQTRAGRVFVLERPGLHAFTFGLLRPTIYLSREVWEGEHREAVLAHERAHARRKDPLWLFLARGVRRSTLYLPFGGRILQDLSLESERACDAAGTKAVGLKPYARALLAFAQQGSGQTRSRSVPTAMAFGWPEAVGLFAFVPVLQWLFTRAQAHFIARRLELLLVARVSRQERLGLFWTMFAGACLFLVALT